MVVSDFVDVLKQGIARNGMSASVYEGATPPGCELVLRYSARRSWDFAPYLSSAELWLFNGDAQVGYADYHLIGGGGFSLIKWQGTATKMNPVIDELFPGRR